MLESDYANEKSSKVMIPRMKPPIENQSSNLRGTEGGKSQEDINISQSNVEDIKIESFVDNNYAKRRVETETWMIEMLELFNKARANAGVGALCFNDILAHAALIHTTDMARNKNLSYTSSDGTRLIDEVKSLGYKYRYYGSLLYMSYGDVPAVKADKYWMNSHDSKEMILNKNYQHIGVAKVMSNDDEEYWTVVFGSSDTDRCSNIGSGSGGVGGNGDKSPSTTTSSTAKGNGGVGGNGNKSPSKTTSSTAKGNGGVGGNGNSSPQIKIWMRRMMSLFNQARAKAGVGALCINYKLTSGALAHSKDMARNENLSYTSSDGTRLIDQVKSVGYEPWYYGSILYMSYGDVRVNKAVEYWMKNPSYKQMILNKNYQHIGVAKVNSNDDGQYWTVVFGSSDTESC